jgi:ATP-dependent helicase/nuclease subunit B
MNWTRSLGGFAPEGDDLRMDPARDVLTAASLLARAGMAGPQQNALARRLMEAAWSLARLVASVAPGERLASGAPGWRRG